MHACIELIDFFHVSVNRITYIEISASADRVHDSLIIALHSALVIVAGSGAWPPTSRAGNALFTKRLGAVRRRRGGLLPRSLRATPSGPCQTPDWRYY